MRQAQFNEPLEASEGLFLLEHGEYEAVFSVAEGHVMFLDTHWVGMKESCSCSSALS